MTAAPSLSLYILLFLVIYCTHIHFQYQLRLQSLALDRLRLIRSLLRVFSAILFNSESIASRFGVLAGPSPLDLHSWLSLLVPDLYGRLCETLGFVTTPDHIEISAEIDKSLLMARSSYAAMNKEKRKGKVWQSRGNGGNDNDDDDGDNDDADIEEPHPYPYTRGRGHSFAELVLTPVKKKEAMFTELVMKMSPKLPQSNVL